ncbi:MAG: hypothetical protein ABR587_16165 [Candidatus Binatia bacterium]
MSTTKGRDATRDALAAPSASGGIDPEDSFLVQIRGGSRVDEHVVSGRIEHLHSGQSEPFGSLTEMLDFLARHFGLAATTNWSDPEEQR